MNSASGVLTDYEPAILHLPPDVHSLAAADEAIEWGRCYGFDLDRSQQAVLRAALGERVDHSWAAGEVADFEGRQAGKNDTAKVRQGAGVDLFGEKLHLSTAHEFATANEDFLRLVAVYENYDDLRAKVARIRFANGEQGIEFLNGARIKYKARSGGSGRGFTKADVVFYDEAQHLHAEHLAASMPTMLANPNFQAWYMGSGGLASSTQAWHLRRRALSGDGGRLAYFENTAQTVALVNGGLSVSSPDDLLAEEVLMTHAGYAAGRVPFENMKTMLDALGPELFAREVLCVWDLPIGEGADGPIHPDHWDLLAVPDSMAEEGTIKLALEVAPDRKFSTFGIAGWRADRFGHVAVRDRRPGTDWVVSRGKELAAGHDTPVIIVSNSPAKGFIALFEAEGVKVDVMKPAEYAAACDRLIDATAGEAPILRHRGDPNLRQAVSVVQMKSDGDGGRVFSRVRSSSDITPLTSVTAAWGRLHQAVDEVYTGRVHDLADYLGDDE